MTTSANPPHLYLASSYFKRLSLSAKSIIFPEIIFRSGGDSIFLAHEPEHGLPVYAVSDGTAPNQCEEGPYIIDECHTREHGIVLVQGARGDAVGQFRYWLKGEPVTVRMSIGVTRELAQLFGVNTFRMEFETKVRRGNRYAEFVEESFTLVGRFESEAT